MATVTPTDPPKATATATPEQAIGPEIVFFGLIRADDKLIEPDGFVGDVPLYQPLVESGFQIVVEAKARREPSGRKLPVGLSTFSESGRPDLQIQATQPLGNGSTAVCDSDNAAPMWGVPAIDPPRFDDDPLVTDALNDFGCRFIDGEGITQGRYCTDAAACVEKESGEFGCVSDEASAQFCGPVPRKLRFPSGDTLLTVRVRERLPPDDKPGNVGATAQLIVRIAPR